MTPAQARLKVRLKETISTLGGKEGAGATARRSPSVAASWGNGNDPAFPPLECALALDEAMIAMGRVPEIVTAMAAELGHVAIRLPDAPEAIGEVTMALIDASAEFGDIADHLREAAKDNHLSPRERRGITRQIDEAIAALVRMRALAEEY